MNSLRQILLGAGVFIGGSVLLYAMVQHNDTPEKTTEGTPDVVLISKDKADTTNQSAFIADIDTETRILAQKKAERELKVAELDKKTREFLVEQERAEKLAMQKARLENQQYRDNAIEPVMEEPVTQLEDSSDSKPTIVTKPVVTKPVVTARVVDVVTEPEAVKPTRPPTTNTAASQPEPAEPEPEPATKPVARQAPSHTQEYTVLRGDGLIKIARQYNVPVQALAQANGLSMRTNLSVGQEIKVPSAKQIDKLVTAYEARSSNSSGATVKAEKKTSKPADKEPVQSKKESLKVDKTPTKSAPTKQLDYKVKPGDALLKLANQYNVPVNALAEANNLSNRSTLRVGQELTIPSRKQIARLQREQEAKEQAAAKKRTAQERLREARSEARNGEAKGTFGVQVTLADNQEKADKIVKKLKAAGYKASTSKTDRGVRVIVGPEKGKPAALALKDKINADSKTDVDDAWVLYWR